MKQITTRRKYQREDSWTPEQDRLLKKNYPTKDNEIVSKLTGKSISALRNRAVKLKIKKATHYWPIEDELYIIQNCKVISVKDMATHLDRTVWAIYGKITELKNNGRIS